MRIDRRFLIILGPVVFGATASKSESSSKVTSTTPGFGASARPDLAKDASPFMNTGSVGQSCVDI